MSKYEWSVAYASKYGVDGNAFAARLSATLNGLEDSGFEIDKLLDDPQGSGAIIIGKKPRQLKRRTSDEP